MQSELCDIMRSGMFYVYLFSIITPCLFLPGRHEEQEALFIEVTSNLKKTGKD
ncbi:MAG: hypothetical protein MJE63_29585 [Proteobacteria bacterium]|nr:hypothetical protein [Pseudomonadota bacterium]